MSATTQTEARTPYRLLSSPLSSSEIKQALASQGLATPARFDWMAISEPDLYTAGAILAVNTRGE